eukprot:Skav231594  [mRNA]  locus=scaffold232:256741:258102:+ [translate_table: standard]
MYRDPKIRIRDFFAFILRTDGAHEASSETAKLRQQDEWLLPLEPGLYEKKTREWFTESDLLVISAKGNVYLFQRSSRVKTSLEHLCLEDFILRDQPASIKTPLREEEIAKIVPKDELDKARKPRPFSSILKGNYGGGLLGGNASSGGIWVDYYDWELTIEPDGSVRYFDAYEKYFEGDDRFLSEDFDSSKGNEKFSRVKRVSRSKNWPVTLHPGPDAHVEVAYPPLCLVELEDGSKFDLGEPKYTEWGMSDPQVSTQSALLSSTKISYHGQVKTEPGVECIVSFPGRYPEGWLECVQGSHDMSVACVFLCGKEDGLGEHAVDPEDGTQCLCHKIYGLSPPREYKQYGYDDQETCEKSGGRPSWGCLWFQRWRNNVELAVARKQKLIVYFFKDQVGQGLVKWDDLPRAELWDGKGLGGSQKGEVAFLQKMGYEFEQRDVGIFLKDFATSTLRID